MIEWPPEEKLDPIASNNLDHFKATAAAMELEEDGATWRVVNWARASGPPMRLTLRNTQTRGEVTFQLESTGAWRSQRSRSDG